MFFSNWSFNQNLEDSFDIAEFSLWVVHIVLSFFIAFYTLIRYKKIEKHNRSKIEMENIFSWVLFFLLLGVANAMNILSRFIIQDESIAMTIDALSHFPIYVSWLVKLVPLEKALREYKLVNTKYFFSSLIVILIIFAIIINPLTFYQGGFILIIFIVFYNIGFFFFPICFTYFAYKSEGVQRIELISLVLGLISLQIGMSLQPTSISIIVSDPALLTYCRIISPIIIFFAILQIFESYRRSLKD